MLFCAAFLPIFVCPSCLCIPHIKGNVVKMAINKVFMISFDCKQMIFKKNEACERVLLYSFLKRGLVRV